MATTLDTIGKIENAPDPGQHHTKEMAQTPPTNKDLLSQLPDELLEHIVKQLSPAPPPERNNSDLRDSDLLRLCLVSKRLHRIASSFVYASFVENRCRRGTLHRFLRTLVERPALASCVRSVVIQDFHDRDDPQPPPEYDPERDHDEMWALLARAEHVRFPVKPGWPYGCSSDVIDLVDEEEMAEVGVAEVVEKKAEKQDPEEEEEEQRAEWPFRFYCFLEAERALLLAQTRNLESLRVDTGGFDFADVFRFACEAARASSGEGRGGLEAAFPVLRRVHLEHKGVGYAHHLEMEYGVAAADLPFGLVRGFLELPSLREFTLSGLWVLAPGALEDWPTSVSSVERLTFMFYKMNEQLAAKMMGACRKLKFVSYIEHRDAPKQVNSAPMLQWPLLGQALQLHGDAIEELRFYCRSGDRSKHTAVSPFPSALAQLRKLKVLEIPWKWLEDGREELPESLETVVLRGKARGHIESNLPALRHLRNHVSRGLGRLQRIKIVACLEDAGSRRFCIRPGTCGELEAMREEFLQNGIVMTGAEGEKLRSKLEAKAYTKYLESRWTASRK